MLPKTVRLIIDNGIKITAQVFQALGRLFLRLGIMLSMHITKTIESCTECKNCNQVIDGKHMVSPPFSDFPIGMESM